MFCTNCRTHFEWLTGQILSTSSNHHYDNTQRFIRPNLPEVLLTAEFKQTEEFRFLWKETMMIKCFLESRLDRRDLARVHYEGLVKIRMNFLRGVDEKACKQKVWILEKAYELKLQECFILETFLDKVRELQSRPDLEDFKKSCELTNQELKKCKSSISLQVGSGPLLLL
jgi:hypothetical protein